MSLLFPSISPPTVCVGIIYLKSHLGRYLSVDSFGNVLCESEERDAGSRFQISIADDNSGRWALKNEQRGYFLGGTPEKLTCTAKAPGREEFWSVHLAARPQVSALKFTQRFFQQFLMSCSRNYSCFNEYFEVPNVFFPVLFILSETDICFL